MIAAWIIFDLAVAGLAVEVETFIGRDAEAGVAACRRNPSPAGDVKRDDSIAEVGEAAGTVGDLFAIVAEVAVAVEVDPGEQPGVAGRVPDRNVNRNDLADGKHGTARTKVDTVLIIRAARVGQVVCRAVQSSGGGLIRIALDIPLSSQRRPYRNMPRTVIDSQRTVTGRRVAEVGLAPDFNAGGELGGLDRDCGIVAEIIQTRRRRGDRIARREHASAR